MKVPPRLRGKNVPLANVSGDQLVRDYLSRVTHASLRLPKGARMVFVSRIRARVERECGPAERVDPGKVLTVLASIGEPEDLVATERARIDAAWAKRRAAKLDADAAAATVERRQHWPITSHILPVTDTQPLPHITSGQETGPLPGDPPTDPGTTSASPGIPPVAESVLSATGRLARRHPLESVAVLLLGVGGAFFPVLPPVWVLGSLLALMSRVWGVRDKWLALTGPLLLTIAGAAVTVLATQVNGNFVVIYFYAFGASAGYLLRLGSVATAVYLAWRLRRGPRPKIPPWQRNSASASH